MKILLRILYAIILIIIGSIMLSLFAAAFVEFYIWISNLFSIQHSLGIDTQMSKNYDSVSGYLPMIVTSLGFSGLLVTAWHHLNCHESGCWRIGRYPVAGGEYKTCRIHHPDSTIRDGISSDLLREAHNKYKESIR